MWLLLTQSSLRDLRLVSLGQSVLPNKPGTISSDPLLLTLLIVTKYAVFISAFSVDEVELPPHTGRDLDVRCTPDLIS